MQSFKHSKNEKFPHEAMKKLGNDYQVSSPVPYVGENRKASLIEEEKEIQEVQDTTNFDTPEAMEWDLLYQALENLKARRPFNQPIYDFQRKQRKEETTKLFPQRVILIEGHLVFTQEKLRNQMHLKIFVDADDDVRLSRRILKMQDESVEKLTRMLVKYQRDVKTGYDKFIEPSKRFADIVVPNYGFNVLTDAKGTCTINEDMCNMPIVNLIAQQIRDRI